MTQEIPRISASSKQARGGEAAGELNDAYLVAQAKRGDSVAYDRIVRRYRGFVLPRPQNSAARLPPTA